MLAGVRQRGHPDTETDSRREPTGIRRFLDRYAADYRFYGSGKLALRDAVAAMRPPTATAHARSLGARQPPHDRPADQMHAPNWNVLLPAYVPDAVAEPLRELDVEPRYFAITPELEPDADDLAARTDDGTIAVVSIDYFGFPQPGIDIVAAHAADHDCYHVDDNAHGTLSVADGRLLGTVGDVGITSLWKTLSVPNGAVLYVTNDRLRDRIDPSVHAGVSDTFTVDDVRFVCARGIDRVLAAEPNLRPVIDLVVDCVYGADVAGPRERYEAAKRPCSKLSAHVCDRADPTAIRTRRRENYRAWLDVGRSTTGLSPLFSTLPEGICPQCMPIEADRPAAVRSQLRAAGLAVHTWPRLPADVTDSPAYATARSLAASVLTLPVDRRVDPETIASLGAALG